MRNIASGSIAASLVGCDSEKNPYENDMVITEKILDLGKENIDINMICNETQGIYKSIAHIVPLDKLDSLMKKIGYVVGGKSDGGFAEVIAELEQIEQEIKNNKNLEASNTKTL